MPESTGAQGRLAQMIATRGGLAPPEEPFVIEHREALFYMLCEASELEHGIMCQYLYAAFSLKQFADEGLTAAEAEAVQRWRKHIFHIGAQEMLHLALVQNLLTATGAAPHLSRPNFPQPASHYPAGVHLALVPFGEEALRHFMFLERPEGMDLEDAAGMARTCALNGLAAAASVAGGLDGIRRIVKVVGFVASAPGFNGQPQVINGASELLIEVFGEDGRHARSAIGVAELPLNVPVEVEMIVEVRD